MKTHYSTYTITINFKDNISGYEKPQTVLDSSIKLINKSDKLREPFNFYLDDKIDGFRKRNKKQIPTIILEPDKEIEI